MRAGAGQRLRARRFERAVVGLDRQGEAQFGMVPAVVILRLAIVRARIILAARRGLRTCAERGEFQRIGARREAAGERDVPVVGAARQLLQHHATRVLEHAERFLVAKTRQIDHGVPRQREGDLRRQIDEARDAGLQLLGFQRNLVIQPVVAGDRARLDAVVAGAKAPLKIAPDRRLADALLVAARNLGRHAVGDRQRDIRVALQREAPHIGLARGALRRRFAPLQPSRRLERQGMRTVAGEFRRRREASQPRRHARLDILGRDDETIAPFFELARQQPGLAGLAERPALGILQTRPPAAADAQKIDGCRGRLA